MCCQGSLAIEGSYHLAGDMHDLACGRTLANLTALRDKEVCPLVDVLKWDAGQLPLRDKSLDVVVTDLVSKRVEDMATLNLVSLLSCSHLGKSNA